MASGCFRGDGGSSGKRSYADREMLSHAKKIQEHNVQLSKVPITSVVIRDFLKRPKVQTRSVGIELWKLHN